MDSTRFGAVRPTKGLGTEVTVSHQTDSVEHRTLRGKVVDEFEDPVGDAFPRLSAMSKLLAVPTTVWAPMNTSRNAITWRSSTARAVPWPCGPTAVLGPTALASRHNAATRHDDMMLPSNLDLHGRPRHLVALGAHPDDIEIACGGTPEAFTTKGTLTW